jgi:hypothetical protein
MNQTIGEVITWREDLLVIINNFLSSAKLDIGIEIGRAEIIIRGYSEIDKVYS